MKPLRFARSARKHRIGKAHVFHVIATADFNITGNRIAWIGADDRGVELEVVLVETDDVFLVIHVMPTALRRN